jgi:hypothetical protein
MGRTNWEELRQEFILGNYKNLREFAEAKGLKYNSDFRQKASGWRTDRQTTARQTTDKIVSKTVEKVSSKVSDDLAKATVKHLNISDKLIREIDKALRNGKELYTFVEKLRTGYEPGNFDEKITAEVLETLNDSKLLNIVNAMEKLQRMQRQTLGIMDEEAKQKLALAKEKSGQTGDGENEDDGFVEALKGQVSDVWKDE